MAANKLQAVKGPASRPVCSLWCGGFGSRSLDADDETWEMLISRRMMKMKLETKETAKKPTGRLVELKRRCPHNNDLQVTACNILCITWRLARILIAVWACHIGNMNMYELVSADDTPWSWLSEAAQSLKQWGHGEKKDESTATKTLMLYRLTGTFPGKKFRIQIYAQTRWIKSLHCQSKTVLMPSK